MRIAFFGGSFDPLHCGHLALAQAAADRLHLDKVLFAPVGRQPLKDHSSSASFEDRLAMVHLATEDEPRFEGSSIDMLREDGHPNYTIDVMERLKLSYGQARLFCLIGADSLLTLPRWHRISELLFLCDFVVAARPGSPVQDFHSYLPEGINAEPFFPDAAGLLEFRLTQHAESSRLFLLPDLENDISATEIRSALAEDADTSGILPRKVASYIRNRHLYR